MNKLKNKYFVPSKYAVFCYVHSLKRLLPQGEVNIAQGELSTFLAEDLQVKGLTQNNTAKYDSN